MDTSAKPSGAQSRSRILIVEDDLDNASTLAAVLEQMGCETLIATNGAEAVLKAFEFQPGIILLDIGLPTMDGYRVAQMLRQSPEFSAVLIIAITGYAESEDKQKAYERGIDLHLAKPVNINFLKELITVSGKQ